MAKDTIAFVDIKKLLGLNRQQSSLAALAEADLKAIHCSPKGSSEGLHVLEERACVGWPGHIVCTDRHRKKLPKYTHSLYLVVTESFNAL